jgi:hypothetical protein
MWWAWVDTRAIEFVKLINISFVPHSLQTPA